MERIAKGIYTPEFRAEAVKLVEKEGLSVDVAAKRLSVPKSSLGNWVRASRKRKLATVAQGIGRSETGARPAKKMYGVFCEGVAVKYARIKELRQHHPVAAMCRILEVSESGYHAWRQRPPSARKQDNLRLETEIKAAHQRTRETYGPQHLQSDLADHGIQTSVYRIKRIRKQARLGYLSPAA